MAVQQSLFWTLGVAASAGEAAMSNRMATCLFLLAACSSGSTLDTSGEARTDPSSVSSVTALIAQTHKNDATCPGNTPPGKGGHCVLDEDLTLDAPLELGSFTKLNCKGHRLLPREAGKDGLPVPGGYAPSV